MMTETAPDPRQAALALEARKRQIEADIEKSFQELKEVLSQSLTMFFDDVLS